jgi:hypothetical protein
MFSAQIVTGGFIRAEVITDDFYEVDGRAIALPPTTGSGNDRYELVFNSTDLNANNELVISHNFTKNPSSVRVLNANRKKIYPDDERDVDTGSVKGVVINLFSYMPFTNFLLVLEV